MSTFDSIFDKNDKIDPELSRIFSKKIKKNDETPHDLDKSNADFELKENTKTFNKTRSQDTENRTIFVGNLKSDCKKEELIKIFKSFGKIESVRFRNIVPEDITKSKKYGFITKQVHPNKKTINAFVRFVNDEAAKTAAAEINGMEYKSLHLRVDIATRSKVHDNKRSLFLGGLPFDITDEDVYQHFLNCGSIEFVRIIRDNKTGIGKGFGYVQFKDTDAVCLGLKLDGSVLNGRNIRVTRCVKKQKKENTKSSSNKKQEYGKQKKLNDDKADRIKSKSPVKSSKKLKKKTRKNTSTNNKNKTIFKI